MQLKYPRFIHAEFMTHRMFSRNASSSRAIPVERVIKALQEDPALPVYWGLNQKGMQARREVDLEIIPDIEKDWLLARDIMITVAKNLIEKYKLHKQIVNRVLEPWAHIYTVVTATEWENFFNLRRHPDAQPEMKVLADRMWEALESSTPRELAHGQWHLPYVLPEDYVKAEERRGTCKDEGLLDLVKVSTARCARVSYRTHDGLTPKFEEDIHLHDELLKNGHLSPFEHPATPLLVETGSLFCGNFRGWRQYRKTIAGEDVFKPGQLPLA
jgi:thymidylate synthase ThyX